MNGPRSLARHAWRRITLRLFASYMVVGLAAVTVLGAAGGFFAVHYFDTHGRQSSGADFEISLLRGLILATLVSLVAAAAVSLFVSRRILEPLGRLMDATSRIADGNYAERVPIVDDYEVTQLAESFNRMAEALAQTEGRRQALIADVAHELRTPLTSIKGYMEALIDGVIPPDPETYTLIGKEADRMYRLVQDLQELSRLEAGQMGLEPGSVSPADLVRSVLARMRPQFEAKGVHLRAEVAQDTGLVWGDADRLCQVLVNLLSNALHHTAAAGQVSVATYNERGRVCISVRDTGVGIAPEHLHQIFTRFYRVDKSRSRLVGGTGIGLTIVKGLVEAHGGTIAVASTPGLGSAFTIALPAYVPFAYGLPVALLPAEHAS